MRVVVLHRVQRVAKREQAALRSAIEGIPQPPPGMLLSGLDVSRETGLVGILFDCVLEAGRLFQRLPFLLLIGERAGRDRLFRVLDLLLGPVEMLRGQIAAELRRCDVLVEQSSREDADHLERRVAAGGADGCHLELRQVPHPVAKVHHFNLLLGEAGRGQARLLNRLVGRGADREEALDGDVRGDQGAHARIAGEPLQMHQALAVEPSQVGRWCVHRGVPRLAGRRPADRQAALVVRVLELQKYLNCRHRCRRVPVAGGPFLGHGRLPVRAGSSGLPQGAGDEASWVARRRLVGPGGDRGSLPWK